MSIAFGSGRAGRRLAVVPVIFFAAALASDFIFWQTGNEPWTALAFWLLGASLALAAVGAVGDLFKITGPKHLEALKSARWHAESNLVLVLIALCYLMARDAYGVDAIVPAGLASAALIVGFFFTAWKRWVGFERPVIDLTHGMGPAEPPLKVRLLPHL